MHKKAQIEGIGFAVLIACMIFFMGSLFIAPLEDSVNDARVNLNCTSAASISDGTKVTCLAVDTVVPWFLLGVFSIAGGLVASRFLI